MSISIDSIETEQLQKIYTCAVNHNDACWALAESLLEAIPEMRRGPKVGDERFLRSLLGEVAQFLAKKGLRYSWTTLKTYRATALLYPPDKRVSGASFLVHQQLVTEELIAKYVKSGASNSAASLRVFRQDQKDQVSRTSSSLRRATRLADLARLYGEEVEKLLLGSKLSNRGLAKLALTAAETWKRVSLRL